MDVVSGLVHLHDLGIVNGDLKSQNVLIIKERTLCAKLSDMGISKRLVGDMSSLGHHATGAGSSGWRAPEQLLSGRQTREVDMFSLGCVLFYCITDGRHPFGDHLERDINIAKNRVDLFLVEHILEAVDLFSHLLDQNVELSVKIQELVAGANHANDKSLWLVRTSSTTTNIAALCDNFGRVKRLPYVIVVGGRRVGGELGLLRIKIEEAENR